MIAPEPPTIVITTYKTNFQINKDANNYNDTLIIRRQSQEIKLTGAAIKDTAISCKTGDNLYVHYNPGKILENQQVKTAFNRLNILFNALSGGKSYGIITINMRGSTNVNYTVQ